MAATTHVLQVLQQEQDWEASQIKYLKLVIPKPYTFMASDSFFIALGIPNNYLKKTTHIKSTLLHDTYRMSPDTSPPQK